MLDEYLVEDRKVGTCTSRRLTGICGDAPMPYTACTAYDEGAVGINEL